MAAVLLAMLLFKEFFFGGKEKIAAEENAGGSGGTADWKFRKVCPFSKLWEKIEDKVKQFVGETGRAPQIVNIMQPAAQPQPLPFPAVRGMVEHGQFGNAEPQNLYSKIAAGAHHIEEADAEKFKKIAGRAQVGFAPTSGSSSSSCRPAGRKICR